MFRPLVRSVSLSLMDWLCLYGIDAAGVELFITPDESIMSGGIIVAGCMPAIVVEHRPSRQDT